MSIRGPNPFNHLYRIEALEGDPNDNQSDEKKRRRVLYQGREWTDQEEDLPVQPVMPEKNDIKGKKGYADPLLMQKALEFYNSLLTIEDKLAQLFFLPACAIYDQEEQELLEDTIRRYNPGGILFSKGEYRREGYLIERYHSLAKTPLLFGNDFFIGLSFYFQGRIPLEVLKQEEDEKHFYDLGEAVMALNRKLGIHIQFDRERVGSEAVSGLSLPEKHYKAFRKGIREGKGVVAREKTVRKRDSIRQSSLLSAGPHLQAPILRLEEASETVGIRTLYMAELSHQIVANEKTLLSELKKPTDVFLIKEGLQTAVETALSLHKKGLLSEEEIERRVMRVLLIKALFYYPIKN